MKKHPLALAALALALSAVSACGPITLPTSIHIKGNAELRFDTKIDVGMMFSNLLEDAVNDADMSIYHCTNTTARTYVIYLNLYSSDFNIGYDATHKPILPDFPGMEQIDVEEFSDNTGYTGTYTLDSPKNLIIPEDPIKLPLSSIGNLLDGFEFFGYETKLFFSGTDLLDKLEIDIKVNDGLSVNIPPGSINIDQPSGWGENWGQYESEYRDSALPAGGYPLNIPLDGNDVNVDIRVFLPAGTDIALNDFIGNINIELVVWLPLEFKANAGGAEIKLPEDTLFSSTNDLFGRSQPEEVGVIQYIEWMSLDIEFDINPFINSELIVTSKNIEIRKYLDGNSIVFTISEENLTKINDYENYPFIPNFTMVFAPEAVLTIPREFKTKIFAFNAYINQIYRFSEK